MSEETETNVQATDIIETKAVEEPKEAEEIKQIEEKKVRRILPEHVVTIFGLSFWDLWIQKIFRNVASIKFQMLILLYVPIIYGMFAGKWIAGAWISKISPATGLAFLGGGYVTLALGRIYAKTRLQESETEKLLDTDM